MPGSSSKLTALSQVAGGHMEAAFAVRFGSNRCSLKADKLEALSLALFHVMKMDSRQSLPFLSYTVCAP